MSSLWHLTAVTSARKENATWLLEYYSSLHVDEYEEHAFRLLSAMSEWFIGCTHKDKTIGQCALLNINGINNFLHVGWDYSQAAYSIRTTLGLFFSG